MTDLDPIEDVRKRMEDSYPELMDRLPKVLFDLFKDSFLTFVAVEEGHEALERVIPILGDIEEELGIRFMDSIINCKEKKYGLDFHMKRWSQITKATLVNSLRQELHSMSNELWGEL